MLNFQLLNSFQKPSETQFWWISLFVGQIHKVSNSTQFHGCSCASWRLSEPASQRPTSAFSAGKPGSRRTNDFPRGLTLSKCRLRAKPMRIRNEHGSWNFVAAWFQSANNSSSVELHKAARLADGARQLLIDATLRPLEAKVERKEDCLILKSHDIWCSPCISGRVVNKSRKRKRYRTNGI